ncbi:MAG TPA: PIN domain-containing protein [Polyangiaceae bacterium]|nr:PIN domain-containing protein [Polyangiaceae bacterium]
MIPRYVFDTGALIAAERGKERASRFLRLAHIGAARIVVPLPVIAEWWRGRTHIRDKILGATQILASLEVTKAAGLALGKMKDVDAQLTIDAMVIATAATLDAIIVTQDPDDFARFGRHFPGVVVLSV